MISNPAQIERMANVLDKAGNFSEIAAMLYPSGPQERYLRQEIRLRLLRAAEAAIDFMLNEARSP